MIGVMRTALLLALAIAAIGCRGDDGKASSGGTVIAVEGQVSAVGPDGTRPLANDDRVVAADTIVTGEASSVRIRLDHNQAVLDLGAGKRVELGASAAWRADKVAGGVLDEHGNDTTAAAGRHAEKEAASTAGTADTTAAAAAAGTTADDITADDDTTAADDTRSHPDPAPDSDPPPAKTGGVRKGFAITGDGAGAGDEGAPLLAQPSPAMEKAMKPVRQRIAACMKELSITKKTRVETRVRIAASGEVEAVTVRGGSAALADCVKKALEAARFPARDEATTIDMPMVFQVQ